VPAFTIRQNILPPADTSPSDTKKGPALFAPTLPKAVSRLKSWSIVPDIGSRTMLSASVLHRLFPESRQPPFGTML